jgi:hypothetical protein
MRLQPSLIEGIGYIISILSVGLLARVAWIGADGEPLLRGLIAVAVILSVTGMALRWYVWSQRYNRHRHKRHKH